MTVIQLRKKIRQSLIGADEKLLRRVLKIVEGKKYKKLPQSLKHITETEAKKKTKAVYNREEMKIQRGLNKRMLETWGGTDTDYREFQKMKAIA